jgi:ammonia channel protein AmtB
MEIMMDKADTAFILAAAGLVLLMTPGLALFYGGMVRSKNVLGTIMQSLFMIALISLEWVYIGYSMSFGPDVGGFIGSLEWFALNGVTSAPSPDYASTIPQTVFMIYQCMFAVITPALITGAFAERVRFGPFIIFRCYGPFLYIILSAIGSGEAVVGSVPWELWILPVALLFILPAELRRWLESWLLVQGGGMAGRVLCPTICR